MQSEQIKTLAINTLDDLKAIDVVVLDVQQLTSITDTMIICSGRSNRHVKAIADNLVEIAKKQGVRPLGIEGEQQAEWVLVDLNDVIVHIMIPETRTYYQLEKLWGYQQPEDEVKAEKKK